MSLLKALKFYGIRLLLLSLFLSFYLIILAANADRIEEYFDPFERFKPAVTQLDEGLYNGGYPNEKVLRTLKTEKGVQRVICLLDPHFPVSRELVANEQRNCEALGIEFVLVAAHDFSRYRDMLPVIREILSEQKKVTYIHDYFMSRRLKNLSAALSYGGRQNLEKPDRQ